MDGTIHQRALRAVARVAWLSVAGCGGATETTPEGAGDTAESTATATNQSAGGSVTSSTGSGGNAASGGVTAASDSTSTASTSSSTNGASTSSTTSATSGSTSTPSGGSAGAAASTGGAAGAATSDMVAESTSSATGICETQVDLELVTCCNEALAPFMSELLVLDASAAQADPTIVACCDAVAALSAVPGPDWSVVAGCCEVAGWPDGVCTPWGPPVPPEFRLPAHLA